MKSGIRQRVRTRAGFRCEYCRFHEDDLPLFLFHVEHIIPKKHRGSDSIANLAWACHYCNLAKSSNLSGVDFRTGRVVPLFNPRRQSWHRNFRWSGARLLGKTASGRATIWVLNINTPHRIATRRMLMDAGLFPPE